MNGRMSGKPTTALINYVMKASKKELRRMLISFITSEPTPIEYEPLDDEPITEEELRATPMHDFNAVREIKETYPKRWTRDIEKLSSYGFNTYKYLLETHQRLADIEDIIYGEGENK